MKPLSLPKASLLRKPREYKKVYSRGKRVRGDRFTIIHLPSGYEGSRLGISVYGVKRAVERNRIKRIIREFFRLNRTFITPASDIVFAVRKGFPADSPAEIKQHVDRMFGGKKDGSAAQQD